MVWKWRHAVRQSGKAWESQRDGFASRCQERQTSSIGPNSAPREACCLIFYVNTISSGATPRSFRSRGKISNSAEKSAREQIWGIVVYQHVPVLDVGSAIYDTAKLSFTPIAHIWQEFMRNWVRDVTCFRPNLARSAQVGSRSSTFITSLLMNWGRNDS